MEKKRIISVAIAAGIIMIACIVLNLFRLKEQNNGYSNAQATPISENNGSADYSSQSSAVPSATENSSNEEQQINQPVDANTAVSETYVCDTCGATFATEQEFYDHQATMGLNESGNYSHPTFHTEPMQAQE